MHLIDGSQLMPFTLALRLATEALFLGIFRRLASMCHGKIIKKKSQFDFKENIFLIAMVTIIIQNYPKGGLQIPVRSQGDVPISTVL